MADEVGKSEIAKHEEEILEFWKREKVFEQSLAKPAPKGEFVFYDGPPFATGLPHQGSLLSSVSKDVIPRYKTMRGYFVRRRWGWDTHGLPIESLVEKKLELKSKKDILAIGVKKFNETARAMVLGYVEDWKRYVERVGRWVDFDNSYKTMDASYTESVWWGLKEIHKKGHLYEGRKVLMYCPHCETPLAKAEIAMDNTYKDVTEEAVTVKFKVKNPEKHNLPANTYLLAWTTTPWTLPGNVALAVGKDIEYQVVLASETPTPTSGQGGNVSAGASDAREYVIRAGSGKKGSELVGIEYEPLFDVPRMRNEKSHRVYAADFVTTDEGTGIVHTAVAYGEDDYTLGLKEGLPVVPMLNPNGTYTDVVPEFLRGQYIKKAEALIKADLESRGLLFKKEMHTHSYPHCYRCGTPLIYNAVSSWFINIQAVKEKMLSENEKITWIPKHLKHGRFQKIMESAPDWTISRNRFWASPLPIWKDKDGNVTVIGSLDELKARTKKSGNQYFVMRHGQAENNVSDTLNGDPSVVFPLTEKGREQARAAGQKLVALGITKIVSSPMPRTQETARIVAEAIDFKGTIETEGSLSEVKFGELEGKPADLLRASLTSLRQWLTDGPAGGENLKDIWRRVGTFLYGIEQRYQNERILIVSHDKPIRMMFAVARGEEGEHMDGAAYGTNFFIENSEVKELPFVPLPHNDHYELDYHLPYIDEVELTDENGGKLTRIPEVVDCWVESGSMPFAEYHYPFENRAEFEKRTPGDFISEYIGQTRAWFYYMHAISTHLFGHRAFKNVVTTGTVLAGDGEKLSKSKKNYTDPYVLFDRYGADAFRYYLVSSVVMQAEDLMFRDEELKEAQQRVVNIFRNTYAFYALFADTAPAPSTASQHVLDRWILARLGEVIRTATEAFDRYDTIRATRPMRDFVEDFSTWYVRRSRDRVKGDDAADRAAALGTMRHVLREFSKVIAPVMPFMAEEVYRGVRTDDDPQSVHLAVWPEAKKKIFDFGGDQKLMSAMADVRRICSLALEARQSANLKVRQPLQRLTIPEKLAPEFLILIKDEVNVKEIVQGEFMLDTTLTDALKKEGEMRDALRAVQDLRKEAGLQPRDGAVLTVRPDDHALYAGHLEELKKGANVVRLETGDTTYVTRA